MRAVRRRFPAWWTDERGDVPGWVLIPLMTAGLATPQSNREIKIALVWANLVGHNREILAAG